MSDDRHFCYPTQETFSRQQVHERTGIADDVLAFWIKQKLLLSLPAARRAHRRFSYQQIHLAVVMNAMRSLGANIGVLRKFSNALQSGFQIWNRSGLDPSQLQICADLATRLKRFSQGYPVRVRIDDEDLDLSGVAKNEDDIIQSWLWTEKKEGANLDLVPFARSIEENSMEINWAISLTDPAYLTHDELNSSWIAWIDERGQPRIAEDNEDVLLREDGPLAAFYIPLPKLIARVWPDRLEAAREQYEAQKQRHMNEWLVNLEATNPTEALIYRRRNGLPENWAESYLQNREDETTR